VNLLARQTIDVVSLITRRFKLTDGVDAFRAAAQSDSIKILMEW